MKTSMTKNGGAQGNGLTRRGEIDAIANNVEPNWRLVLTGERDSTRVKIVVDGEQRWITYVQFSVIVILICERAGSGTGFVKHELIYPKSIRFLREALNGNERQHRANGKPGRKKRNADAPRSKGEEFIETGSTGEYRLRLLPFDTVLVEPSVQELVGMIVWKSPILNQAQYAVLCETCDRR